MMPTSEEKTPGERPGAALKTKYLSLPQSRLTTRITPCTLSFLGSERSPVKT
jgi:hypothetical protein